MVLLRTRSQARKSRRWVKSATALTRIMSVTSQKVATIGSCIAVEKVTVG